MSDDELITAVREAFNGVHSATPLQQIVRRSRALRICRGIRGLAVALAMAGAAAVAVSSLLPAAHQASRPPVAQMAAWTVTRNADGSTFITILEPRNPAGLQSKLRADGVPASVIFNQHQRNPCQSYGRSDDLRLLRRVFALVAPPRGHARTVAIHPSALPSAAGVQIIASQSRITVHLVTRSKGCTGGG